MPKCSMCGKKGFFLKLKNGLCSDCVNKNANESAEEWLLRTSPNYRETKARNEHYNKLYALIGKASDEYKIDKDIDKIISVYEYALIDAKPPITNSQSAILYLAELYIKNNQYDKAWGYLNSILLSHFDLTHKVRFLQCKLLKKEKRFTDAMHMLMLGYLFKSQKNATFKKDAFIKDATVIAKKLEWDTTKLEFLSQIIEKQVNQKNYDEELLTKSYTEFIKNLS